jgi:hypothetical protein
MRFAAPLVLLAVIALPACGGSKSTDPSGNGCFAIVGNKGTVTASISGLPAFSGIVSTGNASFTPASGQVPGIFVVQGIDTKTGTSVLVGGPMVAGTHTMSVSTINGSAVTITVTTRSCTQATGLWTANLAQGAATVTVTNATASGVSGSFTGTIEPGAGSGASGTKTIGGNFSVTF